MKLSDYIVEYLVRIHIPHVFTVTGGACTHIIDSIGKRFEAKGDIDYVCVQHEQAGAMAVDAYSRMTENLGAMVVTSGPGATNMLTGICCAWFDSIPALYISGQVNTFESKGDRAVRQIGFQETDIVSIVKSVTKYAVMVDKPERIRYELEKAVSMATTGRPGPVLIDIPMDVQRANIEPEKFESYVPDVSGEAECAAMLEQRVSESLALIANAKRPVVLVGGGVKLGRAVVEARRTAELLGFPVVVSWSGFDAFPHKHPLFVGQMGVYGNRGANFAVQNADLLLSLGSRLDTRQTGGAPKTFARAAKKIVVDIDTGELHKNRGLNADVAVCANVKDYLTLLTRRLSGVKKVDISPWLEKTRIWRTKYPICLPEYHTEKGAVNAYVFMQELSRVLKPDAVVVTDCGGNLTWTMQAFELKEGQRLFSAMGNSPMGYALPAAIGASIALGKKPVVCIIGDGGLQMNIQELQTIVAYNLPIKIFVMNNHCYGIIKQFQEMYFESRYEATGRGYTVPDFVAIAQAYHMATESIHDHSDALQEKILRALNAPGAMLCDVNIREDQKLVPKLEFGKPIEDLSPLLAREEFLDNMLIKPVSDS